MVIDKTTPLSEEAQETALRLVLTLHEETRPIEGHSNPEALQEDWKSLIKLLSPKEISLELEDVKFPCKDTYFYIELDTSNAPAEKANAVLMYHRGKDPIFLGKMDLQSNGTWQSNVHENVDERIGFNGRPLGTFDNQQEALEALWHSRFRAYAYQME